MIARLFALFGALMLLPGCTTHYRNSLRREYGQVEFDRDWYECRRENTHPSATVFRFYAGAGMEVDEGMAKACLAARGWRPAAARMPQYQPSQSTPTPQPSPSQPTLTAPKPSKSTGPPCDWGMYKETASGQCVKVRE